MTGRRHNAYSQILKGEEWMISFEQVKGQYSLISTYEAYMYNKYFSPLSL